MIVQVAPPESLKTSTMLPSLAKPTETEVL